MTEKQYKELLETLGIGTGKSSADTKELLDAKYNEYLDRTDADAEQMVSDIEDALDYAEDLIVKMGGGIALASEESDKTEEVSQDSFADRTAGRKGATTYTSSSAAGGATTGSGTTSSGVVKKASHPWFYSTTGDRNIEDLFKLAEGDLAQGDYQHAESVYDAILRTEMTNAGAYMGKVLARYNIQEPKDIAICYAQGIATDSDLKRAENCGNDKQKKFIRDALEEGRQAMIYKKAERVLQDRNDVAALLNAATEFESLGAYRDAKEKGKKCREESEKVKIEEKKRREEERRRKEEENRKKEEERRRKEEENRKKEEERRREEEERRREEEENRKKEEERRREEENRKKEEKRRKDEEKRINELTGVIAQVLMFLIIVAVIVYMNIKKDTGGNIGHAFHFGNMNIEGGEEIGIGTYPYITSITAKDVTDLSIFNCEKLNEVTVENSSPVRISSCDTLESLNISGSVKEITVKDCVGLRDISISENFTGNIDIINCDSLNILELPDDFAGSLNIEGCYNLYEVEVPESARSVYVIGSKFIEDGHIH